MPAHFGGLAAADAGATHYLWPVNVGVWQLWQSLQTQWRIGPAGATGLDYAAVRSMLDEQGLDGAARRDAWSGICAAEEAVLAVLDEQRAAARSSGVGGR